MDEEWSMSKISKLSSIFGDSYFTTAKTKVLSIPLGEVDYMDHMMPFGSIKDWRVEIHTFFVKVGCIYF